MSIGSARTEAIGTGGAIDRASLCVLASGSSGNCSVLCLQSASTTDLYLIDAGLSPRRTGRLLEACGRSLDQVRGVLFTHLDTDHFNESWIAALPAKASFFLHRRHRGRAERAGLLRRKTEQFETRFQVGPFGAVEVSPILVDHDDLGVAAFRFEIPGPSGFGRSLGFATDLGRVPSHLVNHLVGVDVLAIESNYCPVLQEASARPRYLKDRIMGGAGHLSNAEAAEAVRRIGPRDRVVLLHLSRECNRSERALAAHAGAPCEVVLSRHDEPTDWLDLTPRARVQVAAPAPSLLPA